MHEKDKDSLAILPYLRYIQVSSSRFALLAVGLAIEWLPYPTLSPAPDPMGGCGVRGGRTPARGRKVPTQQQHTNFNTAVVLLLLRRLATLSHKREGSGGGRGLSSFKQLVCARTQSFGVRVQLFLGVSRKLVSVRWLELGRGR